MSIKVNLAHIHQQIIAACQQYNRDPQTIKLVAVSKTRICQEILTAMHYGQYAFAENYVQEALTKITALHDQPLEWHFIGPIQSNKTKVIAQHFDWVHSVDRYKVAEFLNSYRPSPLPPLNVCIQVNISGEATKSGVNCNEVLDLARRIQLLPHLQLRGLMAIPATSSDFNLQRHMFHRLRELQDTLIQSTTLPLDTLSMGMSNDFVAAIAEGATIIRVGTAIFGER